MIRIVIVVGGGVVGFFGVINCVRNLLEGRVILLEVGLKFLVKVCIFGGGCCNVIYYCFDLI